MGEMAGQLKDQGQRIHTLEATMVLQETYVNRLQAQYNTKNEKKEPRTRLLGDGLPVLLSGDDFYEKVKEQQQRLNAEEKRKIQASHPRKQHSEEMKRWKQADNERKRRNEATKTAYRAKLQDWERRKALAKAGKQRFTESRPLRGSLEKAAPKPSKVQEYEEEASGEEYFDVGGVGSEEDEENDDDDCGE